MFVAIYIVYLIVGYSENANEGILHTMYLHTYI